MRNFENKTPFRPACGRPEQGVGSPTPETRPGGHSRETSAFGAAPPLAPRTAAARSFRDRAVFLVAAAQAGPARTRTSLCSNMRALDPARAVPLLGGGERRGVTQPAIHGSFLGSRCRAGLGPLDVAIAIPCESERVEPAPAEHQSQSGNFITDFRSKAFDHPLFLRSRRRTRPEKARGQPKRLRKLREN